MAKDDDTVKSGSGVWASPARSGTPLPRPSPEDAFSSTETVRTISPFADGPSTELATTPSHDVELIGSRTGGDALRGSEIGRVLDALDDAISPFQSEVFGSLSQLSDETTVDRRVERAPAPPPPVVETVMSPRPELSTDLHDDEPVTAVPLAKRKATLANGDFQGFMMGGYHVLRRLGQGGMALVFLAKTPGSDEPVVLKKIRPSLLSDEKYVRLFRREARIASSLHHENIVRILDQAAERGESFLVMEYLDGLDVRDLADRTWTARKALPLEAVLEVLVGAARGLDYAHQLTDAHGTAEGLVHRDISPENLFVTRSGTTKVLDFGIARGRSTEEKLTRTGEVKGKVPYMSPEQIQGTELDVRSDLFSLAVTAYWLLTGQRPFDGTSNFMTIKRILEREASPPSTLNPFIPSSVDAVIMKALAKDRGQRFARARDFADALDALLARLSPERITMADVVPEVCAIPRPDKDPTLVSVASRPSTEWDDD